MYNGLALIQKVPTPITPINIDKESRHITLAYVFHEILVLELFDPKTLPAAVLHSVPEHIQLADTHIVH